MFPSLNGASERRKYTVRRLFDTLSDRLQGALGDLRKRGTLDDEAVSRAMREIRLALLEADVNFQVVKQFVETVRERAIGEDVAKSLTPGQQVVKIVHEELTALMGSGSSRLAFAGRPPTVILLAGPPGLGQDDDGGEARAAPPQGGRAAGARRGGPAAPGGDRAARAARQADLDPGLRGGARRSGEGGARRARASARRVDRDVVILDTAGRLHVDEALMEELARVRDEAKPHNVLLVLDAMTGQEAVNVAQSFQERIAFDGVVMTKLDGDARGGAALSVKAVTGKPIKLASTGEKLDQLDWFHPDRMASRILGMGDVLTLIERAEQAVEEDEQAEMEKRMRAGQFTFDDFLKAQKMLKRMGPFQNVLKLIPGMGKQLGDIDVDEKQLARVEAIVLSMTPRERSLPHVIDGSRRQRIARGQRHDRAAGQPAPRRAQADGEADEADGQGQDGNARPRVAAERRGDAAAVAAAEAVGDEETSKNKRKKKKARR